MLVVARPPISTNMARAVGAYSRPTPPAIFRQMLVGETEGEGIPVRANFTRQLRLAVAAAAIACLTGPIALGQARATGVQISPVAIQLLSGGTTFPQTTASGGEALTTTELDTALA